MSVARAFRFVSLLLVWALPSAASAATIYAWTDAQGVRHFSQYPPADGEQVVETRDLETSPGAARSAERLQTIRDVARELEAARQQREQQRAQSAPPIAPAEPVEEPDDRPVLVVPYPVYPRQPGAAPYPPRYPYPYPPPRPGPRDRKPDRSPGSETKSPGRTPAPGMRITP